MSSGVPTHSARRTVSFSASEVYDADGMVESFSTSASAVELAASDFDGDAVNSDGTAWLKLPRSVVIVLSSSAGSYNDEDPIVLTGRRGSEVVTEELTPTTADGNETLRGRQVFDFPPDVSIPAQENTSGAFTFGVQDIAPPSPADTFTALKLHEAGTLNVEYRGGRADAMPTQAHDLEPIAVARVLTDPTLASATDVGLTVYIP